MNGGDNSNTTDTWMRDCVSFSSDGILVLDQTLHVLTGNRAAARMLGAEHGPIESRCFGDFIAASVKDRFRHELDRVLAGDWDFMETRITRAERDFPVMINAMNTVFHGKAAILLHIRDASVLTSLEKALKASRDEWEQSFDAITDAICILNRHGKVIRANKAAEILFADRGNPIGRHFKELLEPADDARAPDVIKDAPFTVREAEFASLKGWYCLMAYPLERDQSLHTGAIVILKDVSEQHAMQDALARGEREMRQMSKMAAVGRLVDGVAHDFNNFLTVILGYGASALSALNQTHSAHSDVKEIIRTGEQASSLIRQLLNLSHESKIETCAVNLNSVVAGMEDFLRKTLGQAVKLVLRPFEGLWETLADVSRVEQIVMNLAINAGDAMPEGGTLTIESSNIALAAADCAAHAGLTPGDYVMLAVSDTGKGISREVMDHMFEPFFTTKEKKGGTGIGLTTVYGVVKQFNGHILCYSEPGKGATFKIYLPRAAAVEAGVETGKPRPPAAKSDIRALNNETILVVDDEEQILTMISRMLSSLGYRVLPAASGAAALEASSNNTEKIHMVISDIVLPDTSGQDLVLSIRKNRPEIRAIFTSGYSSKAIAQSGMLGPDDVFVGKPFSLDGFARTIRKLLDDSRPDNA